MTRAVLAARQTRSTSRGTLAAATGAGIVALAILTGCGGGSAGGPVSPGSAASTAATTASGTVSPPGTASVPTVPGPSTTPAPSAASSAPGPAGGVDATVSLAPVSTLPAEPIGATAGSAGVGVRISRVESVQGEAQGPGQVAGPAVRVTVVIDNATSTPLRLDTVTVDVRDATGEPALQLAGPGARPFGGSIAANVSADGVYVFGLDPAARSDVTVLVTYDGAAPTVAFRGDM